MTYLEKLDLEEKLIQFGEGGKKLSLAEQKQKQEIINERRSLLEFPEKLVKALSVHSKPNRRGNFL